jgi:formylglycine-generating enzyme required for sulfatase activity
VGVRPVPDYELVQQLGQGGFGEVWKAKGPGGFAVALKFIRLGNKAGAVELRSLEVMKDIRHAHLLGVFGAWQRQELLIIAMELADRSLLDRLYEATAQGLPGIPRDELLEYMREAAKGIDHLNGLDIQHRDIKPHNLLLVGGSVKVADFGLAKLLEHTITSITGAMTPAYAAPEFFGGRTSGWSDQYSLAVSYGQLRTGRLPFEGSHLQVMAGHATQPPDLSMLPESERPAVARALAKKPEERWPSCRAFVEALAAEATRAVAPTPTTRPAPPSLARTRTQPPPTPKGKLEPRHNPVRPPSLRAPVARSWFWRTVAGLLTLVGFLGLAGLFALLAHRNNPGNSSSLATTDKTGSKEVTNSIGMKLMLIPAGKFMMGSPPDEAERETLDKGSETQHEVEITQPFYLGKYLVTQAEYERVMHDNPSWFSATGEGKEKVAGMETHRFPVDSIHWQMAENFCDGLSKLPDEKAAQRTYRLPTEAEWEYACREGGRSLTPFYFGNSLSSLQANFDGDSPYGGAAKGPYLQRTTKVGTYEPNQLGLYDMHGNLWEWCHDWYDKDYYKNSPTKDPQGPDHGDRRVLRGGSWFARGWYCRSASRSIPDKGYMEWGFRVVLVAGARAP